MTPPPSVSHRRAQPWRRKGTGIGEREFLTRVQSSDGFWKSLNGLSKATGMEVDALEGYAVDICQSVWSEADAAMASEGPLAAERDEVDRLKQKLRDCNLSAMKQMLVSKAGNHFDGDLGDDTITFHEPLHYLDQQTKNLVMSIVCDKMRQLEQNTAPPSLVQALVAHAQAQAGPAVDTASAEELKELKAQLEDVRGDLRKARMRAEDAEDKNTKFEALLMAAETRARMFEEELAKTKTLLATCEVKLASAEEALAKLRAEHAALLEAHAKLKEVSAKQKLEIERQSKEIERERKANEKLRAEVERLQEYVRRAEQLEKELKALQVRFDALEAEANTMREELARRNNTCTAGTQTALTGPKLDELSNERRKLKLMLEELQTKLKELMTAYRRKFGDDASKIANDLGLKELLKEETVFQRLYDDALERVHRLEQLRLKVKQERKGGGYPAEPDIMQAVEENQPSAAMQQLIQNKMVDSDSPLRADVSLWATRPQRHDQACGDDAIAKDVYQRLQKTPTPMMNKSTSLPSIQKPEQHVINLSMGQVRRGSKRREFF